MLASVVEKASFDPPNNVETISFETQHLLITYNKFSSKIILCFQMMIISLVDILKHTQNIYVDIISKICGGNALHGHLQLEISSLCPGYQLEGAARHWY